LDNLILTGVCVLKAMSISAADARVFLASVFFPLTVTRWRRETKRSSDRQAKWMAGPALLSLMVMFTLILSGCGGGSGSTSPTTAAYISFSGPAGSSTNVAVGGTAQLKVIATI